MSAPDRPTFGEEKRDPRRRRRDPDVAGNRDDRAGAGGRCRSAPRRRPPSIARIASTRSHVIRVNSSKPAMSRSTSAADDVVNVAAGTERLAGAA